jgi:hypothetical protein
MSIRVAARGFALAVAIGCGASTAQAQIPTSFPNPPGGEFTYQFADPTTGAPITTLTLPTVGSTARVALYLLQTGGTPVNLFQQLGAEGLGVRLNYSSPAGVIKVPTTGNANITARPPPAFNPNLVSSDYDLIFRYGAGTGTDTTTTAAIVEGLLDKTNPLPFPGAEDPTGAAGNARRMLIGTFTLQALLGGTETVQAVSPFAGINSLTGPNPQIIGPRNDGTNGPRAGDGNTNGEILLDPLLTQNATVPTIPTLTVVVGVPEPSTLALGGLAAAGLAAWRRRRTPTAVAV